MPAPYPPMPAPAPQVGYAQPYAAPTPFAPQFMAPPAPAPAPPAPAPVPQAVPQTPPAGGGQGPASSVTENNETYNYPANTALAEMSEAQRTEYWRHKARRHEERNKAMSDYDQLKAQAEQYQTLVTASQTEKQREVAEAHRQGRTEALTEAGTRLVDQWMRAATYGRLPEESVNALLLGLDRKAFLTAAGDVDTAKVYAFVGSLIPPAAPAAPAVGDPAAAGNPGLQQNPPAPPAVPPGMVPAPASTTPPGGVDFGQGHPGQSKPTGLAAGREIARQRFGTQSTTGASAQQ